MSKNQYIPIAKRTRFQFYKYCDNQTRVSRQTDREVVDEYEVKKNAASKTDHDNEAGPSRSKVRVKKSDSLDDSDSHEKQEDSLQSTEDDEDDSLSSKESNSEYEPLSSTENESEDEQSSSSDSESDNSEDSNCLPKKRKKPASKTVFEGPSRPTKGKCDEAKKGDKVLVDESEEERNHYNGPSRSKARVKKLYNIDESSSDEESKEKESNTEPEDSDGIEELDISEFEKAVMETKGYNSEDSIKTKTHMHFVYLSDDSDSDDKKEAEESDGVEELDISEFEKHVMETKSCNSEDSIRTETHIHFVYSSDDSDSDDIKEVVTRANRSQSTSKADTFLSPEDYEDEPSSSRESGDEDEPPSSRESGDEDEPPVKKKQSSTEKTKEKVRSGSTDRKEHDPLVHKTKMQKMDKKPIDEPSNINVHKRKKSRNIVNDRYTMGESSGLDRYTRVDKSSSDEESSKGSPKDDGGSAEAILDTVIGNEGVQGKKNVGSYKFRFEDSEDESMNKKTDEFGAEGLFEEMNFALECEEIDSYRAPTVDKQEKDDDISPIDLCRRGEHREVYFEEQTGFRCCVCGAVTLETKDVISKHANYAPDKSKGSYRFDEQRWSSSENPYLEASDEAGPSKSKASVKKSYNIDESSSDEESKKKESNTESEESDGVEELDISEFEKHVMETKGCNSEDSIRTGTHIHFVYSSDDSDSDDIKEEADGSESNSKADTFQSPEDDENELSSESESGDEDEPPVKRKQSCTGKTKEKVQSGSTDRKKHDPLVHKTRKKKMDKKPMDELCNISVHRRKKAINILNDHYTMGESSGLDHYTRVDKSSSDEESNKGSSKDDGGSAEAILDSVIGNEGVEGKKNVGSYKFRFEDSEDESKNQKTDEAEGLFEEMDFAFECEEIGSYRAPTVEKREKDDNISPIDLCQRGKHGEVYFEEQTGFRCCVCGAVTLETKDAISKQANYAPDKSKRSYRFDEQRWSSSGNPYPEASDCNSPDIMGNQTVGTVWELIPTSIRSHLYPHQQQAFKFLWENLAGTIELSELQKLGPRGGGGSGGCIISHAPGTGKTLLTIIFVDTFLKRFPKCCPIIVAPASTLLTWEAETKKWSVGFSFINLNNSEAVRKERINASTRHNIDVIRAGKLSSWSSGGSVLGISYHLYTKVAGNLNTTNKLLEKMRNVLLDMPGLVVLDEGHTPRNHTSNMWNTLLKLKTKNRVILSGTLFQNNFKELFNSLRLVRPETVKERIFSDVIRQNMKRSRSNEDVEKLKMIISPFVHVHEGHILESKLPGLKETIILLDPPPIQKSLIENLENMTTAFEFEHKVALVSVHPSLILHFSLSEKEEKLVNKQELKKMRIQPDCGVKTRFVMELIRLSVSLHEKVLIFSQYLKPLELLQYQVARAFGWDVGTEIVVIDGTISQMHRQRTINNFNDPNGKAKALLASTRCCSEGIHLYGASRVVLLDVVWNPSVEKQAISRAYRLGQKKVVYTYHLIAGTTEEDKYDQQMKKARLSEMVFSSGSIASADGSKKVNVDDKILQHMVDHQELKHMFKKIRHPENQRRV